MFISSYADMKTEMNPGSLILLQDGLFPEYTGKTHTVL